MAIDTVRLFATPPSLWDLGNRLHEHRVNAETFATGIGNQLDTIPDLDGQQQAFSSLWALRQALATIAQLEDELYLAHGLRD